MEEVFIEASRSLIDFTRDYSHDIYIDSDMEETKESRDNVNQINQEANKLEHYLDCKNIDEPNEDPNGNYYCPHTCPRCIEPFEEDATGELQSGSFEWSWCDECKVCENCEHLNDCSQANDYDIGQPQQN